MSRKLDAAVADALGWRGVRYSARSDSAQGMLPHEDATTTVPEYSEDGNAMLELDKEMRARGYQLQYEFHYSEHDACYYTGVLPRKNYRAVANAEPLARAFAAYKALTGNEWERREEE